jgi:hypothetical protein
MDKSHSASARMNPAALSIMIHALSRYSMLIQLVSHSVVPVFNSNYFGKCLGCSKVYISLTVLDNISIDSKFSVTISCI